MKLEAIDRVDKLTREEFQKNYYIPQKPVIFRSFSESWKARDLWTYDFFKQDAGDVKVDVFGSWTKNHPTKISRTPQQVMPFKEYLSLIESGPTEYRLFLFDLFKHKPEYRRHFNFPDVASGWVKTHPFLFFGGQDSDVRLHFDIDLSNVFLTQFEGKKHVVLFSPDQSHLLYKQPFSSHSNVDMRHPDYEKFPAISKLHGFEGDISRGDTLFMPSAYWHYIYYTTSGFSMALRTLNSSYVKKARAAYNVLVMKTVDDLLSKISDKKWSDYKLRKAKETAEKSL
ncbi:MAG: cupin-like domain-containing protein [Bacteroidetes bacterium]|nr:cupin-like domain-containing protein [Bacteroidota bacterium]